MWLKLTETQRNYTSPISCYSDCPSSGSLIFGGQMVHINEGKGKLDLFNTKDNVLLTPHPSYSSAIDLFPFLILLFSFNFYPRTHRPYIDPTSTLMDPTMTLPPTFFSHHHISIVFLHHNHHHVFIVSLFYHHRHHTPHFYCFLLRIGWVWGPCRVDVWSLNIKNCPCLRNWNATLNCEWIIIAESR